MLSHIYPKSYESARWDFGVANRQKRAIGQASINVHKRTLFYDTIVNKVDTKGRVSLPADYRALTKDLGTAIVCYRSFTAPCIEGTTALTMERLASEIENSHDFFSEEQDDLTNLVFGDAREFSFDSTGRISLPAKLLEHAGITDAAVFVGKGRKFQIWTPENWEQEEQRIRERALKRRPSIKPAAVQQESE